MAIIEAAHVSKSFEFYKKEEGIKSSFKNLFHREKLIKDAVKDLSFSVEEGEIVGFLGPNGAGKTTTLKLLSGIIYPTHGDILVNGYIPWNRANLFKKQIAVVMAQKNQLWWDLPANESILLNKHIYEIPDAEYKKTLSDLVEIFGVQDLLAVQVRRLSLGERMKFEIISSLIHRPKVIFLDEPTIGLDLMAQRDMRKFIKDYNKLYKSTVILTSHYMQDIEELCSRAIIISHGEKVYDGSLNDIKRDDIKVLTFSVDNLNFDRGELFNFGKIRKEEEGRISLEVEHNHIRICLLHLLNKYDLTDFSVEDLPIEEKILNLYEAGAR
ncbi:multidrug ABC transporter ATP-binding protein [Paenibacillus riograndensis]|uniref:Multidrug ABC transporter ATP-binding protein n=1 Tax=Paenibacillus riograndensis TaxID=483937 RepID=A0A132UCA2_9BACL|nr:ATP-binding cassette domain-containing protein [Paenibacillus riograndensis]KWX81158.1 multidrug ABC transporter ATP-binding protein [Paenibacillus riograndensis]